MVDARDGGGLASLSGATVVLGVSGGIAAYKAVEVCRRLTDAGATVLPVLTRSALRFVGATTFSALASEPVRSSLFEDADPIPHTRLGRRADLVLVCPATARLLGEYAVGISRDLLGAVLIATRAPVLVCPAMHTEMWQHPAVQENLATLRRRGVAVVDPESGHLAGGDIGEGRLAEPETIVAAAAALLAPERDLAGRHVLVTAGGTREPIDAVRFLSNRSSGRQGHALANAAARRGAAVTLVTAAELSAGPGVEIVRIETAAELADAVLTRAGEADVVIMAAAVADYTVAAPLDRKWKKRDGPPSITLVETVDVLAALGARRRPEQVLVGFAAETDDVLANGEHKLKEKGADLLVVNDVSAPGVGFGHETNAVTILGASAGPIEVPLSAKSAVADAVLDAVVTRLAENATHGA